MKNMNNWWFTPAVMAFTIGGTLYAYDEIDPVVLRYLCAHKLATCLYVFLNYAAGWRAFDLLQGQGWRWLVFPVVSVLFAYINAVVYERVERAAHAQFDAAR
jgi:hypothetical protein